MSPSECNAKYIAMGWDQNGKILSKIGSPSDSGHE